MAEIFNLIGEHINDNEQIAEWYTAHRQRTLNRLTADGC